MNLKQLLHECPNTGLKLLTGKEGLEQRVSWVHVMESLEMTQFLKGGELVLCTGVGLPAKEDLLKFVKEIHKQNAVGVAFDSGKYIPEIPSKVIDYCDNHGLPLFIVPKEVAFENIMHPFCKKIVESETKQHTISTAFKNAIFFPEQKELYMVQLLENHFEEEWRYCVSVLQFDQHFENPYQRSESIISQLQQTLAHRYHDFAILSGIENEIIVVFHTESMQKVREFNKALMQQAQWILHQNENLCIGVGKLTKSIRCLYKSYKQAKAIMHLQQKHTIPNDKYLYQDMGSYRILLGIEDDDIKKEYFDTVLGPLIHYDTEQDTDLVQTLRIYLEENGSVQKTADKLFIHRNTVNYKINKAAQILNMDLSQLNNRLEIMLGFMLYDMI